VIISKNFLFRQLAEQQKSQAELSSKVEQLEDEKLKLRWLTALVLIKQCVQLYGVNVLNVLLYATDEFEASCQLSCLLRYINPMFVIRTNLRLVLERKFTCAGKQT